MDPEIPREPCSCIFLHNEATNIESPIEFDAALNEFHTRHDGGGYSMIYFCPFCGGAAPKSLRSDLFSTISDEEEARLVSLLEPIKSAENLMSAFGKPDNDKHTLAYKNISESAIVVGLIENEVWKGTFFSRKQIKKIEREAEQASPSDGDKSAD